MNNNTADALNLKDWTDELKYLNRMNLMDFKEWLFPNATDDYLAGKWELFGRDKLGFIWSCSLDKIAKIIEYIGWCKRDC